jgi:Flp pilus assembly protein CpaB
MKPKSMILLGVSGLFGLVAAALFTTAIGQSGRAVPTKAVLIVAEDVEIGATLTEQNCRLEQWPQNIIPEGIVGSFEELADKRLNTRLSKNTPVFQRDLLDKHNRVLVSVPVGKKVVGLKLPSEDHIAGLLQPGHTVDVIGVFEHQDRSFSKTFLRGIKVYSVSNKTALETEPNAKSNESDITVGLVVTERQSEMLTLVRAVANVKLAVRGVEDTEFATSEFESQTGTISLNELIGVPKTDGDQASLELPSEQADGEPFKMQFFRGDFYHLYTIEDGKAPVLETGPPSQPADNQAPVENP